MDELIARATSKGSTNTKQTSAANIYNANKDKLSEMLQNASQKVLIQVLQNYYNKPNIKRLNG